MHGLTGHAIFHLYPKARGQFSVEVWERKWSRKSVLKQGADFYTSFITLTKPGHQRFLQVSFPHTSEIKSLHINKINDLCSKDLNSNGHSWLFTNTSGGSTSIIYTITQVKLPKELRTLRWTLVNICEETENFHKCLTKKGFAWWAKCEPEPADQEVFPRQGQGCRHSGTSFFSIKHYVQIKNY